MERSLTKEQKKAIATLLGYIVHFHALRANAAAIRRDEPMLQTGFIATSYFPFLKTNLPRVPRNWVWNQSNAKVLVELNDKSVVTFRKVSPKKKNSVQEKAPSYKVWLFQVEYKTKQDEYYLWCEKGRELGEGVDTEIGTVFPQDVSTESLSFLRVFVEDSTAVELGW